MLVTNGAFFFYELHYHSCFKMLKYNHVIYTKVNKLGCQIPKSNPLKVMTRMTNMVVEAIRPTSFNDHLQIQE
jgi:hypothetical protein